MAIGRKTHLPQVKIPPTEQNVSKLEFHFVFCFVLIRVISWIVLFGSVKRTIHEITRINTKPSNAQIRTSTSSFDTVSAVGVISLSRQSPRSILKIYVCQKLRLPPDVCGLLKGKGKLDQFGFAPGRAKERNPKRQTKYVPSGHCDVWIPGDCRG